MRSLKRFSVALVLGLTWACGGPEIGTDAGPTDAGGQDAGAPDAGPTDAGPTDVDPPVIVSSDPVDATLPIGVLTTFSVVVSETLDPESVTSATVALTDQFDNPVPGRIEYDVLTQTIRVDPSLALRTGIGYTLTIGGIRDEAGNELAEAVAIHVRTYVDPLSSTVVYSRATGNISQHTEYVVDESGRCIGDTYYNGPGSDGDWYTSDDTIGFVDVSERVGDEVTWRTLEDPGSDGEFRTDDDVVSAVYVQTLDDLDRIVREYAANAGDDGVLETADDVPDGYLVQDYDASGLVVRESEYSAPGPNGVWFDEDDVASSRATIETHDISGRLVDFRQYQSPGPDRTWFTSDDVLSFHNAYTYDDAARQMMRLDTAPGPDGLDGTDDDVIRGYAVGRLDADGRPVELLAYAMAGEDGRWMTEDDAPSQRTVWTFGAHDNLVAEAGHQGAGPDGRWGTIDDVLTSVRLHDPEL